MWIRQLQRTRTEWAGPALKYCYVCSDRFTEDTYELVHRGKWRKKEPKKVRLTFKKHERKRIIENFLAGASATADSSNSNANNDNIVMETNDIVEIQVPLTRTFSCQTQPQVKSKKIQTGLKHGCDKHAQTEGGVATRSKCVQIGDGQINLCEHFSTSENEDTEDEHAVIIYTNIESEDEAVALECNFSNEK